MECTVKDKLDRTVLKKTNVLRVLKNRIERLFFFLHTIFYVLNCIVEYRKIQYRTVAVQHGTIQYSTIQYNTVQYSTLQ